ncbi:hypothetical protein QE152_g37547 [Popillia japonica]|uniref:Fibronectin type-III domain-containing protein n=1 Tax=Popillia japonica TaxID=7064 RepID=A0AAW1IA70_POPJA
MNLTQKQWKIVFGVVIGVGVTLVMAGVIVLLVTQLSGEDFCDTPASLPTLLYASENEGDVTIQWSRTIYTCAGGYLLQFSINDEALVQVSTVDIQYTVIKPPICSDMLIRLWTVGESGRISEESVDRNYTVLPSNIYDTNTAVTRTDTGIVASWEQVTQLETCDVSYIVRLTSEFGQFDEETVANSITIPDDSFCFTLRVQVSIVVGFSQMWFWTAGYVFAGSIVADITIPPENPFEPIATWTHDNEDICSLSYEVTYTVGTQTQTTAVVEPRVTFNVQYCVYGTLTIVPSALDGEHTGWSSLIGVLHYPNNIRFQPIENVEFEMDDLSMIVSWDVPDALSHCRDLYHVTARNDDLDEEDSCLGTSSCVVTLSDFCPILPSNSYVTNTAVTKTDMGIVASWRQPTQLEACDVSYVVRLTSEFGEFDEETVAHSITIPDDSFCFTLRVQVSIVVGFSQMWFWTAGYVFAGSIVPDITIPPENPFERIATWTHDNEDICSLSYEVTYTVGIQMQTTTVLEPRVKLYVP